MAKILICTGIFPPQVGGPAQYAKEVASEFKNQGYAVKVLTYKLERKLPTLIRHKLFFCRVLLSLRGVDFILALDTFSVGWPAVMAARLLHKKILIRTGGDFLWESYVERTGDLVLFREFYDKCNDHGTDRNHNRRKFNFKERLIFKITKWTLQNASAVIFSTDWQRRIFEKAYSLNPTKNFIVENFYGEKLPEISSPDQSKRIFVAGTRPLKWKNLPRLKMAFEEARIDISRKSNPEIYLDLSSSPYVDFLKKIQKSYAVILVSLGDISPNMILDAIQANRPFIVTKETGLFEKLKDVAIFVDPENPEEIKEKIIFLTDKNNYESQKNKIRAFNFSHSWKEICNEIINTAQTASV